MARQMGDVLANVGAQAERRLDALNNYFPPAPKPSMSFDEYLPRAILHAQSDEKFARELAKALYQAQRIGG